MRLSPHDLSHFSTDWCNRCWWFAKRHGIKPPSAPFPAVVNQIDKQMTEHFRGSDISWLGIPGTVRNDKKTWVLSKPIETEYGPIELGGFPDAIVDMQDGTVAVVDYKMTNPKPSTVTKYEAQLNSYQFAIENPLEGEPLVVSSLWLVCWAPGQLTISEDMDHPQVLMGGLTVMNVKQDQAHIRKLLESHAKILYGDMPPASSLCETCGYMSNIAAKAKALKEKRAMVAEKVA